MIYNNYLGLRANIAEKSPAAVCRLESGYYCYETVGMCTLHFCQMAMYMRRNYTHLSWRSLSILMQVSNVSELGVVFHGGYNPQDDEDVVRLAMHMQRVECSNKIGYVASMEDIREAWVKYIQTYAL